MEHAETSTWNPKRVADSSLASIRRSLGEGEMVSVQLACGQDLDIVQQARVELRSSLLSGRAPGSRSHAPTPMLLPPHGEPLFFVQESAKPRFGGGRKRATLTTSSHDPPSAVFPRHGQLCETHTTSGAGSDQNSLTQSPHHPAGRSTSAVPHAWRSRSLASDMARCPSVLR